MERGGQKFLKKSRKKGLKSRFNTERNALRDFVLLSLEKDGIFPGSLFQAKDDTLLLELVSGDNFSFAKQEIERRIQVSSNAEDMAVMTPVIDILRVHQVDKGTLALFLDVDCEVIVSGSCTVVVKVLVGEKVLAATYEPIEDLQEYGISFVFREWQKVETPYF